MVSLYEICKHSGWSWKGGKAEVVNNHSKIKIIFRKAGRKTKSATEAEKTKSLRQRAREVIHELS